MAKKNFLSLSTFNRKFLLLAPILLLLGAGVYTRTTSKATPALACPTDNFTGEIELNEKIATFEGKKIPVELIAGGTVPKVLGVVAPASRWIEVDLSEQKLKAWDGGSLFLETAVSSGLPWTPTPRGVFEIAIKLRATKMSGGSGRNYYYLPNVPYVMFFGNKEVPSWRGYSLHGTYWHSDFGRQRSHGCVNLPTPIAEKLYYWVGPVLPDGKSVVYADPQNPGTRVVIHD